MDGISAPDLIEEIVGWRAWRVREIESGPVLLSMFTLEDELGTFWPGDRWLEAVCEHAQDPPCNRGHCGIYAARDRRHLLAQGYQRPESFEPVVIGTVGLAGRVKRCARGYRAARAHPLSLLVPYEHWLLVRGLRARYRVPVQLANTLSIEEALGWT